MAYGEMMSPSIKFNCQEPTLKFDDLSFHTKNNFNNAQIIQSLFIDT